VPDASLFDPAKWMKNGAVTGTASGRGSTFFLNTDFGPAALRLYKRGGWPAKLSEDRYFYTGIERSRPYREFHLLRKMSEAGLPVPAPIAVLIDNSMLTYRGALLLDQIENVTPLSDSLGIVPANSDIWANTGTCIRKFHEAGVDHVDLNASNLLIDARVNKVFLVDFDRCTYTPGNPVNGESNLARLKRSFAKLWPDNGQVSLDDCWQALLNAYHV
jgi:3-deoxy-D-manno-octulosonic acid kinase